MDSNRRNTSLTDAEIRAIIDDTERQALGGWAGAIARAGLGTLALYCGGFRRRGFPDGGAGPAVWCLHPRIGGIHPIRGPLGLDEAAHQCSAGATGNCPADRIAGDDSCHACIAGDDSCHACDTRSGLRRYRWRLVVETVSETQRREPSLSRDGVDDDQTVAIAGRDGALGLRDLAKLRFQDDLGRRRHLPVRHALPAGRLHRLHRWCPREAPPSLDRQSPQEPSLRHRIDRPDAVELAGVGHHHLVPERRADRPEPRASASSSAPTSAPPPAPG